MLHTSLHRIEGPWPGALAIAARPRGDDWLADEIRSWRAIGANVVVSLLTHSEITDLGLENEGADCHREGVEFENFPIMDRMVPESVAAACEVIDRIARDLVTGQNIVIHCRQGVGRAGMVAAAVLMRSGVSLKTALDRIGKARGVAVPETEPQLVWLERFDARIHQAA